ncbi:mechanosensitive ion channel family protein [bacterium]|nr:mechanosensitive ion channel family protein [bacterium]
MFLSEIGDWFRKIFESIGSFFTHNEEGQLSNLEKILFSIVLIVVAWVVIKLIVLFLRRAMGLKKTNNIDRSAKSFIVSVIKALLWVFVAFLVISILGIDMTSFAGVLSAITVALGLALQDVIGSFAAGLIILNQKNFKTDDYIQISNSFGQVEGTVVNVALMYTSLRTVNGQVIFVPNSNVVKSNLTNYTKESQRRITYTVNVAYDSDVELVKNVLLNLLNSDERISQDKMPQVHVNELGDFSVSFVIKCWTDNDKYWDVYNGLHERILLAFRENNINIPSSKEIKVIQ